jgi:hypothetical protein
VPDEEEEDFVLEKAQNKSQESVENGVELDDKDRER